jgi:hypothetical protein
MQDDLFTPTIRERTADGTPPWRPDSILYPAFFGGPLAAATLGVINGRRLGVATGPLVGIAVAGVAAFVGRLGVTAALGGNTGLRLIGSVAGILVWLVVIAYQRRPFRAFTFADGEPASLVGPGIVAVLAGAILETVVIAGVVR